MDMNETRSLVLDVPPTWGDMAMGETKAKILVTLLELLEYDLPEVRVNAFHLHAFQEWSTSAWT